MYLSSSEEPRDPVYCRRPEYSPLNSLPFTSSRTPSCISFRVARIRGILTVLGVSSMCLGFGLPTTLPYDRIPKRYQWLPLTRDVFACVT